MKKVILIGILSVASIFSSGNIWAANKNGGKQKFKTENHQKAKHDPDKKLEKWKTELNLTDKQVADLKVIFQRHKEKMQVLKADGAENKDARKALKREMRKEMMSVLDEKQKAKLKEMRAENKAKNSHKKGNMRKNK